MLDFIGRFHPLFVHLPIGMLVLAMLFKMMSLNQRWAALKTTLPLMLGVSFLSAMGTSFTGYLLSLSGEYDMELVRQHQWAGVALTILIGVIWLLEWRTMPKWLQGTTWSGLVVLLIVTGHWGGSLTHGEDFLRFKGNQKKEQAVITNIREALVYQDLVVPVLESKCYACHSNRKKKGNLRLDTPDWIVKGGDQGKSLLAHQPRQSNLYTRLILPNLDEEHMPPKGKPQPSESEIELLYWWIEKGASFDKKIKELPEYEADLAFLVSFTHQETTNTAPYLPEVTVEAAQPAVLDQLKAQGVIALPVALNSNYLSVNLLEKKEIDDTLIDLLLQIKAQIVWLKAGNTNLSPSLLDAISQLSNLQLLHLNGTSISDEGLSQLSGLEQLKVLNLTQTVITEQGIQSLANLTDLKKMYLFQSQVTPSPALEDLFPNTELDFGGYETLFSQQLGVEAEATE
ncbi:MAG: c-type cytochrome domain-containing protein [Bacteroidota bacterium]